MKKPVGAFGPGDLSIASSVGRANVDEHAAPGIPADILAPIAGNSNLSRKVASADEGGQALVSGVKALQRKLLRDLS